MKWAEAVKGAPWRGLLTCLALGLGLALATGCLPSNDPKDWPVARVIATAEAQVYLKNCDFERYKNLDGTRVEAEAVPAERLAERLAAGKSPDLVLLTRRELLGELQGKGLIDTAWLLEFERDPLAVVTPPNSALALHAAPDLLRGEVKSLGLDGSGFSDVGRITEGTLGRLGLWGRLEPKVQRGRNQAQVLEWVEQGRVDAAIVSQSALHKQRPGLKPRLIIDPRPELPPYVAIAVLKRSEDPVAARRLWNYSEKCLRSFDLALAPLAAPGR